MNYTEEPRYVDDPFEDDQWKYPGNDLERDMLQVCGRKRFPTRALAENVHRITSLTVQGKRKYDDQYIRQMIAWAAEKNARTIAIDIKRLISAIRNPKNLGTYQNAYGLLDDTDTEGQSKYADVPDYED